MAWEILPESSIRYSRRRKRSDAWIVDREALEEVVHVLRSADQVRHDRLARELVSRMKESQKEAES